MTRAVSPCLRAFRAARALPSGERGPVDFEALRRLAAIRRGVGMAVPCPICPYWTVIFSYRREISSGIGLEGVSAQFQHGNFRCVLGLRADRVSRGPPPPAARRPQHRTLFDDLGAVVRPPRRQPHTGLCCGTAGDIALTSELQPAMREARNKRCERVASIEANPVQAISSTLSPIPSSVSDCAFSSLNFALRLSCFPLDFRNQSPFEVPRQRSLCRSRFPERLP